MTKTLLLVALLSLAATATFGQTEGADPLFGRYDLANSDELLIAKQDLQPIMRMVPMDFDPIGDSLKMGTSYAFSSPNGTPDSEGQFDVITGDFDGDGEDEVAMAWEGPNRKLNLRIVNSAPNSLNWTHDDGFQTGDNFVHSQDPNYHTWNIRLAAGNFDEDPNDEFVLAHWSETGQIIATLYNTGDDLIPVSTATEAVGAFAVGQGPKTAMDIATGDFDADGTDEIIVIYYMTHPTRAFSVAALVYDLDEEGGLVLAAGQPWAYVNSRTNSYMLERVAVATGNFDDDLADEVVLGVQSFHGYWASVGTPPFTLHLEYHCWTNCELMPFEVDLEEPAIVRDTLDQVRQYNHWAQEVAFHDYTTSPPARYRSGRPLDIATGDLNADGRDEIVFTGLTQRGNVNNTAATVYSVGDSLSLTPVTTIDMNRPYGDGSRRIVAIADLDLDNTGDVDWLQELTIVDYAQNYSFGQFRVYRPTVSSTDNSLTGLDLVDDVTGYLEVEGALQLVSGDFDGDSFHLGPPTWFETDSVFQPIVVLNSPPVHFDIIGPGPDDTIDVGRCYGLYHDASNCNFRATYNKDSASTEMLESDLHADWGVSLEMGGKYEGPGAKVEASMTASYGEKFGKASGASESVNITVKESAAGDDRIYGSLLTYDIWEYPVFYSGEHQPGANLVVAVPNHDSQRRSWVNSTHSWAWKYRPSHEPGNILSYRRYASIADNPDIGDSIRKIQGDGRDMGGSAPSSGWDLLIGDFGSSERKRSWDAKLEVEASVEAGGFQASVEGSYGWGEVSTYTTTVSDQLGINVAFSAIDMTIGDVSYMVTPYAYWAENGALVIDYEVDDLYGAPGSPGEASPAAETWWQIHYGREHDPALNLPWLYSDAKHTQTLSDSTMRYRTKEIWAVPHRPDPGDTVTLYVRVHNYSLFEAPVTVPVDFFMTDTLGKSYEGGLPIADETGTTSFVTGEMGPRAMDTVSIRWVIPPDMPKYTRIWAALDRNDDIDEVHENNNKGYCVLFVPRGGDDPTAVDDFSGDVLPIDFSLSQNHPNPFNPSTRIEFALPSRAEVKIEIFNILGQKVRTLINESRPAGNHAVMWDGHSEADKSVSSGVYLYRLTAGDYTDTKKMLLLK